MHRINTATKAVDKFGSGKHGFNDGNRAGGIAATVVDAAWADSVQEELANAIELEGGTLDPNDNTQLWKAMAQRHGQCSLMLSGGNLVLSPFNGNRLIINRASYAIPSAGVSLAPAGLVPITATTNRVIASSVATIAHAALSAPLPVGTLIAVRDIGGANASSYNGHRVVTASTTATTSFASGGVSTDASTADTAGRMTPHYYIYAYMSSGVMTLEASTTGHSADTSTGVEIKTGDASRSLVGLAVLNAGPAWVNTRAQRFVRSWFNSSRIDFGNVFAANRNTANSTYTELSSAERAEFLLWGIEAIALATSGRMDNSAVVGAEVDVSIGIDGANPIDTYGGLIYGSGPTYGPASCFATVSSFVEGYHYATILGRAIGGGTSTFVGGSAGSRTAISGMIG